MAISRALTTVTPFSRLVALILFILLPFLGFYLGIEYQKSITPHYPPLQFDPSSLSKPMPKYPQQRDTDARGVFPPDNNMRELTPGDDAPMLIPSDSPRTIPPARPDTQKLCTMDAKQCPDGTWVGRTGPNCEFMCK